MSAFNPHTAAKIATALEEADRTATPAPWRISARDGSSYMGLIRGPGDAQICMMQVGWHRDGQPSRGTPDDPDARLIVSLRNHASTAAAQLRAAIGEVERLSKENAWNTAHVRMMTRAADTEKAEAKHWRAAVARLTEENERLTTRQQELLATIVRVTNETPYPDEIKGWQSQRSAMIAEVGSLKAEVIGLKRALLEVERDRDRCLAAVVESGTRSDSLSARLAEVEAERERLKTIVGPECAICGTLRQPPCRHTIPTTPPENKP